MLNLIFCLVSSKKYAHIIVLKMAYVCLEYQFLVLKRLPVHSSQEYFLQSYNTIYMQVDMQYTLWTTFFEYKILLDICKIRVCATLSNAL